MKVALGKFASILHYFHHDRRLFVPASDQYTDIIFKLETTILERFSNTMFEKMYP